MGKGQIRRSSKTGLYHPKNGKASGYEFLVGSRRQVHNGTAFKTTGGLKKKDLMLNKHGRIVSVSKHNTAKKEKRLVKLVTLLKRVSLVLLRKLLRVLRVLRRRAPRRSKLINTN